MKPCFNKCRISQLKLLNEIFQQRGGAVKALTPKARPFCDRQFGALAAPAPGAGGQRRGAIQAWPDAPNVLLVVSDSFVSMERQGRGRPAAEPRLAQPFPCL